MIQSTKSSLAYASSSSNLVRFSGLRALTSSSAPPTQPAFPPTLRSLQDPKVLGNQQQRTFEDDPIKKNLDSPGLPPRKSIMDNKQLAKGLINAKATVETRPFTAAVFGATGFLGKYVMNELGKRGCFAHVAVRGDDMEWRDFKQMFGLGKLMPHYYDPRDEASVQACIPKDEVDVVINLVGKRYETKHVLPWWINNTFEDAHVRAPQVIAKAARRANVKSFVHASAATAHEDSPSRWARSKAQGEHAVESEFPGANIVRMGRLYGSEDYFINQWAKYARKRFFHGPIVVDGGETKMRPVYVGDAARGIVKVAGDWNNIVGERIDLLGNDTLTHKQIIEYLYEIAKRPPAFHDVKSDAGLLDFESHFWRLHAQIRNLLPNPIMTPDMLELMRCDDLESPAELNPLTFKSLGITPQPFEQKAHNYALVWAMRVSPRGRVVVRIGQPPADAPKA